MKLRRRWTGDLRFRLSVTYVAFFAILLGILGLFFRETLSTVYESQLRAILTDEWVALRNYLRIERPKRSAPGPVIHWYYDRDDPEEAIIVDRLRQVYILADGDGDFLEIGPRFREVPLPSRNEIQSVLEARSAEPSWQVREDRGGTRYLIRSGMVMGEDGRPYYIALGRSYGDGDRVVRQFTWYYSWMLPVMILSAGVLGWSMARRALQPLNQVALTAERITGSNLRGQIPLRGSGDELDRLIGSFNRMIERLDQSFRQTRAFSTDVSHELRTPLTAIRGQLEVALLAARTPEQYQEAIINALQEVERLSQTIRALLLLSQAESGQLALQREAVDLSRLTSEIIEQFEIPAEGAHLDIVSSIEPGVQFNADRIQIERLLSNLISNAVKYTPAGGRITVTLRQNASGVELVVADSGIGIAPDHLPYIFDRFYRVPETQRRTGDVSVERGLGLGLSFVSWIVKAHGGSIDVHSKPGEGATFTVRLPRPKPGFAERPESSATPVNIP